MSQGSLDAALSKVESLAEEVQEQTEELEKGEEEEKDHQDHEAQEIPAELTAQAQAGKLIVEEEVQIGRVGASAGMFLPLLYVYWYMELNFLFSKLNCTRLRLGVGTQLLRLARTLRDFWQWVR